MPVSPRHELCALLFSIGLTAGVLGCGDDSGGGMASETSGAVTASVSATETSSAPSTTSDTNSATGATATATTGGSTTQAMTTASESGTTAASQACPNSPAHNCSDAVDCGEDCGTMDSIFDENGCSRGECQTHAECGESSLCYHAEDYGGCVSSDLSCNEDADGECFCGSDPDCGGSYCVPSEIFFGGAALGPTQGWVDHGCTADDGPAFVLLLGLAANDCDGANDGQPLLRIEIAEAPGQPGTFTLDTPGNTGEYAANGDLKTAASVPIGVVRIFSWVNDTAQGEYEVRFADASVVAGSFSVPFCNRDVVCG